MSFIDHWCLVANSGRAGRDPSSSILLCGLWQAGTRQCDGAAMGRLKLGVFLDEALGCQACIDISAWMCYDRQFRFDEADSTFRSKSVIPGAGDIVADDILIVHSMNEILYSCHNSKR